jgi:hypothetical protein
MAAVIASQLVGALQLARALGDNSEGKAPLDATRRAPLERHDTSASPDPLECVTTLAAFTFEHHDAHQCGMHATPLTL